MVVMVMMVLVMMVMMMMVMGEVVAIAPHLKAKQWRNVSQQGEVEY